METKRLKKLVLMAGIALAYFAAGKVGLTVAYVHPSATGLWPPAGIALAALLIFGYETWPAILLGALLVSFTRGLPPLAALGIAAGSTLEPLAGAWLVNRYAAGRNAVYRTPDIFKFALLAGLLSTVIGATFGAGCVAWGVAGKSPAYGRIWMTWWLGDGGGVVLLAPLLILWIGRPRLHWRPAQFFEAAALLAGLLLAGLVVFNGVLLPANQSYPLEYLCIPFLLWVAYRFGQRETAAATLILATTAAWGTMAGYGPFAGHSHRATLLLLQTFVGVIAVTTLGLAAMFAERRQAEEHARMLSVSDPLTGLGNYRKLIDALEAEIHRSDRTGRPFSLLLLDLDSLKSINDAHGHLVGSRALCRLGGVLRQYSRSIDTAARYGGDEFALIVPEAGPDAAQHVARRIAARLTDDGEAPALSVSIGVAEYPRDGETIEKLLCAADADLYRRKSVLRRGTAAHGYKVRVES